MINRELSGIYRHPYQVMQIAARQIQFSLPMTGRFKIIGFPDLTHQNIHI
jgi:hypothetical protein